MMLLAAMAAIAALMLAATPAMADDFDRHDFCRLFDCNDNNNDFCDDGSFFDNCRFDRFNNDFCNDGSFFDNCRFDRFNNGSGFGDFEQDADSGDIDQSFDVTGGGDNSNQTVGIQGVGNTGNAQNQIGVTDLGNNFDNFDRNDFDRNDFCDDFDGNDFCHDLRDFCDDFDRDGFCDNLFDRFNRFDRLNRFDRFDNGFGDFEFEDSGASIDVSPTNMTTSDQSVNQAATAVGK
jgi:hypothetical protein